eukprot:GHVS01066115.1.p1 GENE.GHVS01066115.1~~GHVS01066115.1.p1  ORF type:complete len:318 (+),score=40.80 GHVS01066115.1:61-1014(+)
MQLSLLITFVLSLAAIVLFHVPTVRAVPKGETKGEEPTEGEAKGQTNSVLQQPTGSQGEIEPEPTEFSLRGTGKTIALKPTEVRAVQPGEGETKAIAPKAAQEWKEAATRRGTETTKFIQKIAEEALLNASRQARLRDAMKDLLRQEAVANPLMEAVAKKLCLEETIAMAEASVPGSQGASVPEPTERKANICPPGVLMTALYGESMQTRVERVFGESMQTRAERVRKDGEQTVAKDELKEEDILALLKDKLKAHLSTEETRNAVIARLCLANSKEEKNIYSPDVVFHGLGLKDPLKEIRNSVYGEPTEGSQGDDNQ